MAKCILFSLVLLVVLEACYGMPSVAPTAGETTQENNGLIILTAPGYHTMEGVCDDFCPLNRNTVCKLDCRLIDGTYTDCIYHFYSKETGRPVYHCWE